MSISVVTLAWRDAAIAPKFADSLSRAWAVTEDEVLQLILVVNGPEGELAVAAFESIRPADRIRLQIVRLDPNLGFTGGSNAGVARTTGDVIVLASLDITFDANFFRELTAEAPIADWDFLVARTEQPDPATAGTTTHNTGAAKRNFLHRHKWLDPQPDHRTKVQAGNGSCMIFRKAVLRDRVSSEGALFDPEYYTFWEDNDLFWWADRKRLRVIYSPSLIVYHALSATNDGKNRFRDRSTVTQQQVMRNFRLTAWKHATTPLDLVKWIAGEVIYAGQSAEKGGLKGLGRYCASWLDTAQAWKHIHSRRGRLRPQISKRRFVGDPRQP